LKFGLTTGISRKKNKDIIQIKIKEPPKVKLKVTPNQL